jgi:hypothetical protein
MALTKDTASRIIDVVAADANCRKAIQPNPQLDFLEFLNPAPGMLLEYSHLAGSVRNLAMMFQGKYIGDPTFDERICVGITYVTFKAIFSAIGQGKLPGVRVAGNAHRVHRGTHHEATSIDMVDGSTYIFDWHATLKVLDPAISRFDDWLEARNAINFTLFSGFN